MHAVALEEICDDGVADVAEVAREDEVIVLRRSHRVKMRAERLIRRRRHGGAHIRHVLHAEIRDDAGGEIGHARAAPLPAEQQRARAGDRPLRRGRAHAAVFQREAVLPLGGAEVAARHGGAAFGKAAVDQYGREPDRLRHRGAGAVEPEIRRGDAAHGVGRPGTLVLQVAGEEIVELPRVKFRLGQQMRQTAAEHGALAGLPRFRAEIGVRLHEIKPVAERPLPLLAPGHAGLGQNHRRTEKAHRLPPKSFFSQKTSPGVRVRTF